MKHSILFLSFLLLTFKIGHSQTNVYHPFPDSASVWNIHYGAYCFSNGTGNADYSIVISGDTLISSQTYHKLITQYVQDFSTGTCGPTGILGYRGAIRQDKINKKVFFVPPSNSTVQLLYDFNMQVGDTVKGYIEGATLSGIPDIVQSIDSVLVGSNYHKRWKTNSIYGVSFIEGIGSTYGLIERSPGNVTDQAGYLIMCFKQNGITLYPSTATNCDILTSVNSIEKNLNQIKIFPNPTIGKFAIKNEGVAIERCEVEIYNVLGEKVYSTTNSDKRTENSFLLMPDGLSLMADLSAQPNGIYFINIKTDKEILNEKIAIQK